MTLDEVINKCKEFHSSIVCYSEEEYKKLMFKLELRYMKWCDGNLPTHLDIEDVGGVPIGIYIDEYNYLTKTQDVDYIESHDAYYYSEIGDESSLVTPTFTFEEAFFGVKGE